MIKNQKQPIKRTSSFSYRAPPIRNQSSFRCHTLRIRSIFAAPSVLWNTNQIYALVNDFDGPQSALHPH